MNKGGKDATPQGVGNQVSLEFNLAYRWHSATSYNDELWTEEIYKELFGKPASEVTMPELLMGLHKYQASMDKDPSKRTFAHLKRQEDGTFKDDDLVKILKEAVEDVAGKHFSWAFLSSREYPVAHPITRLFRSTKRSKSTTFHRHFGH